MSTSKLLESASVLETQTAVAPAPYSGYLGSIYLGQTGKRQVADLIVTTEVTRVPHAERAGFH